MENAKLGKAFALCPPEVDGYVQAFTFTYLEYPGKGKAIALPYPADAECLKVFALPYPENAKKIKAKAFFRKTQLV